MKDHMTKWLENDGIYGKYWGADKSQPNGGFGNSLNPVSSTLLNRENTIFKIGFKATIGFIKLDVGLEVCHWPSS